MILLCMDVSYKDPQIFVFQSNTGKNLEEIDQVPA